MLSNVALGGVRLVKPECSALCIDFGTLGVLKDTFRFKRTPTITSPGPEKCSLVMFSVQDLC